jgi:hypothetical protein
MSLGEKQRLFMQLLGEFLVWIYQQPGYSVVGGQLQRTQAEANANAASGAGISNSLHIKCLAIDLMLFIGGAYKTKSEEYQLLGDKWKSMHSLCRWGGDFKTRPDGNHFSLEHEGVR